MLYLFNIFSIHWSNGSTCKVITWRIIHIWALRWTRYTDLTNESQWSQCVHNQIKNVEETIQRVGNETQRTDNEAQRIVNETQRIQIMSQCVGDEMQCIGNALQRIFNGKRVCVVFPYAGFSQIGSHIHFDLLECTFYLNFNNVQNIGPNFAFSIHSDRK